MVITDTSHFSPERAEVVEADAPAHGLVISIRICVFNMSIDKPVG